MREILYKAKESESKEWVEGFLFRALYDCTEKMCMGCGPVYIGEYYDLPDNCVFIDEETICQYTGFKDRNCVKIFEGDRLKIKLDKEYFYPVIFQNGVFSAGDIPLNTWKNIGYEIEVIGNIFDK